MRPDEPSVDDDFSHLAFYESRFDAFVEESYLPYASTYKASIKSDESLLRLHLLPRFGRKPINAITRNDIVMMHQARRNEGAAPATARTTSGNNL